MCVVPHAYLRLEAFPFSLESILREIHFASQSESV